MDSKLNNDKDDDLKEALIDPDIDKLPKEVIISSISSDNILKPNTNIYNVDKETKTGGKLNFTFDMMSVITILRDSKFIKVDESTIIETKIDDGGNIEDDIIDDNQGDIDSDDIKDDDQGDVDSDDISDDDQGDVDDDDIKDDVSVDGDKNNNKDQDYLPSGQESDDGQDDDTIDQKSDDRISISPGDKIKIPEKFKKGNLDNITQGNQNLFHILKMSDIEHVKKFKVNETKAKSSIMTSQKSSYSFVKIRDKIRNNRPITRLEYNYLISLVKKVKEIQMKMNRKQYMNFINNL